MGNSTLQQLITDSLIQYVQKLNDEIRNGAIIVVEGKRDAEALREIGLKGRIFKLCHNHSISHLVSESEKYRKVILLFDLDRKGRILTKKSIIMLEAKKIKVDLFFRRKLSSITQGQVTEIEELSKYSESLSASRIENLNPENF